MSETVTIFALLSPVFLALVFCAALVFLTQSAAKERDDLLKKIMAKNLSENQQEQDNRE